MVLFTSLARSKEVDLTDLKYFVFNQVTFKESNDTRTPITNPVNLLIAIQFS